MSADNEQRSPQFHGTIRDAFSRIPVLAMYTIAFAITGFIAFVPLVFEGKGFINIVDGLPLYYGGFVDTGNTVRDAVAGLISGKGLHFPAYDLSIGYGSSVNWTHDPFMYLSALCPVRYSEALFNALVVVRLWLVGVCSLHLARRLDAKGVWGVLLALVYTFSGWGLNCVLQISFLNIMALFPLLVDGAMELVDTRRAWRFLFSGGALCFVCGMYLFYVSLLLIAVLTAVVLLVRGARLKDWLWYLGVFLGCIALAMLMGCDRILELRKISSLDRISISYSNPLLYSPSYYQQLISGFPGVLFGGRDWFFGFGACGLLGTVALFLGKPDRMTSVLRVLFVFGVVFLCAPVIGSAFNGFSYAVNRWVYGFSLLVACIVGTQGKRIFTLGTGELAKLALVVGAYCILAVWMAYFEGVETRWQVLALWVLIALLIMRQQFRGVACTAIIVAVSVVAIGMNWAVFLWSRGTNWQSRLVPNGDAYAMVASETPAALAAHEEMSEYARTDRSVSLSDGVTTRGLVAQRILDTYGIGYYSQLYNNSVDRFHRDLALACSDIPNTYSTLDQRASLMRLLGVGNYVCAEYDSMPLPYGVEREAADVMETRDKLVFELHDMIRPSSLGLVFDGVIDTDTYQGLSPLERQEALLQGVAVEGDYAERFERVTPQLTSASVPYSVQNESTDIRVEGNTIEVRRAYAGLTLKLGETIKSAEGYLYVAGLSFVAFSPRECYTEETWAELTAAERKDVMRNDGRWETPSSFAIGIRTDVSSGTDSITTPYSHLYGGKDTWLWNLGYTDTGINYITISFSQPGIYSFDDVGVLAQPMKTYDAATEKLSRQPVKDFSFDDDTVTCTATAQQGQLLFLSIPYDGSWKATINGEDAEILVADTAFMAIPLLDGVNNVKLTYQSRQGLAAMVGITAFAASLCLWLFARRRHGKRGV